MNWGLSARDHEADGTGRDRLGQSTPVASSGQATAKRLAGIALWFVFLTFATGPPNVYPAFLLGFVWHWTALLIWLLAACAAVRGAWRRWDRGAPRALVGAVVAAGFVLAQLPQLPRLFLISDGRTWFEDHRSGFEAAAAWAEKEGCCGGGLYGERLPWHLRWLSVDGSVSGDGDHLFFPQWFGVPDDAGGFFHVASGSPEGKDMAGMICESPVDLSDGWWMCGMKL